MRRLSTTAMIGRKRKRDELEVYEQLISAREILEEAISPEAENRSRRRRSGRMASYSIETASSASVGSGICQEGQELVPYDDYEAKKIIPAVKLIQDAHQDPLSVSDFLTRLATFDISRWSRKPDCLASFHCARYGWQFCDSMNALVCVHCQEVIPVSDRSGGRLRGTAGSDYDLKLREAIENTRHRPDCPWRKRFSPVTILSLPKDLEMLCFLRSGAESFSLTFEPPELTSPYQKVLESLDLEWLIGITEREFMNEIEWQSRFNLPYLRKLIHFLLLNGWSLADASTDNCLHCCLCLREVPLWIFKSKKSAGTKEKSPTSEESGSPFHPVKCSEDEVSVESNANAKSCEDKAFQPEDLVAQTGPDNLSTVRIPSDVSVSYGKSGELDPVTNHWWWCPWRRFLVLSSEETSGSELRISEYDVFSNGLEDSKCLRKVAQTDDYDRLRQLIEAECSVAVRRKDRVVRLVSSVPSIMEDFVGKRCLDSSTVRTSSVRVSCSRYSLGLGTDSNTSETESDATLPKLGPRLSTSKFESEIASEPPLDARVEKTVSAVSILDNGAEGDTVGNLVGEDSEISKQISLKQVGSFC